MKTHDNMLDAYNQRPNKSQAFDQWYKWQLKRRGSNELDHPDLPRVWIDPDAEDDGLMPVNAPKKPSPDRPPTDLYQYQDPPEIEDDPKQLVHA